MLKKLSLISGFCGLLLSSHAANAGTAASVLGLNVIAATGLTITCTTLDADGHSCDIAANAPAGTVFATTAATQIPGPNPSTWTLTFSNLSGQAAQLQLAQGTGANATAIVTGVAAPSAGFTLGAGSATVTASW